MDFEDSRLEGIAINNPESLYKLVVEELCGEKYYAPFDENISLQLSKFLERVREEGLNYAQFNELLLLLDQDRVSPAFFDYFFKAQMTLEQMRESIIHFRGFAILAFGNFRFAYKELSRCKSEKHLMRLLKPFSKPPSDLKAEFDGRPPTALKIEIIPSDKTWCNGYIAKKKYEKEAKLIKKTLSANESDELVKQAEYYEQLGLDIQEIESRALRNTDAYLSWDYMDVYVATSMRNSWEFEDTGAFVAELFHNEKIKSLKLRYFDPTQSQCANRIDKGLVEALMLKRAHCTVYMVQETDTLGKDSELASTLAQGKPVIAYVPRIDVENRSKRLLNFPLEFFKLRFQVLQAEGMFDDEKIQERLSSEEMEFEKVINGFLNAYDAYRKAQPLSLWASKEQEFKSQDASFEKITRLLAILEEASFDKRATILKETHPLSLQVHLDSGVANGVLVVRTVEECAQVLNQLLLNELTFSFGIVQDKAKPTDKGVTVLQEKTSKSPFRAVTHYEKLANSFWNFYLIPEHLTD
jgi:hypothetical protein